MSVRNPEPEAVTTTATPECPTPGHDARLPETVPRTAPTDGDRGFGR